MNLGLHGSVLCIEYLNDKMYIGGYFFNSEDTSNVICSFTNNENGIWSGLSYGILGSVTSLANLNNRIYAAGMFDISGGYNGRNNITTWDGVNWSSCDGGVLDVSENAIITSMAVYNNYIYLFGKFTSGNSIICKNVISIHN